MSCHAAQSEGGRGGACGRGGGGNFGVNLRGLAHRGIGQVLTDEELASVVRVSERTIADILADDLPSDPTIFEQFARHFRIHADFFQSGGPPHSERLFDVIENTHRSPADLPKRRHLWIM